MKFGDRFFFGDNFFCSEKRPHASHGCGIRVEANSTNSQLLGRSGSKVVAWVVWSLIDMASGEIEDMLWGAMNNLPFF